MTLNSIADVYERQGKHLEALEKYRESLRLKQKIGDKEGEATSLSNMGLTLMQMGKVADAATQFEASLRIDQALHNVPGQAVTLANLGAAYWKLGKDQEALDKWRESASLGQRLGEPDVVMHTYSNMGDMYKYQKQWPQAVEAYRKTVEQIEILREATKEPSLQTSFFQQYSSAYFSLASALLETKAPPVDIFSLSEQAKARTLVQMLQNGHVQLQRAMTVAEQRQEQHFIANVAAVTKRLNEARSTRRTDDSEIPRLQHELEQARRAADAFQRHLFLAHPDLRTQRGQFVPVTLTEINRTLHSCETELCVLSYLVGPDETLLYVIMRGQNSASPAQLKIFHIPVEREQLIAKVNSFWKCCATADGRRRQRGVELVSTPEKLDYKKEARELYNLLIHPVEKELEGKTGLLISPDGILNKLPFQALINGHGQFLCENFALSYAPSVSALTKMSAVADQRRGQWEETSNGRNAAIIGRPEFAHDAEQLSDLPDTESEARQIAALFGVEPILGSAATKQRALNEMEHARYIHFATHGLLNEAVPMYSAIALTRTPVDDGRLYAQELVNSDTKAELVVLSACQTALGQLADGEGILGLSWALFAAGCPSSVVTQWSVADDSTSTLMTEFYRQLLAGKDKISKAEALRRAQIKLIREPEHAHPFYWAPFILVGAWK